MNKGIAVHHTPNLRRGHEGADGHHTATQRFGRGNNIGYNTPVFDTPELASTSHTRLYFVGNEQYFIFITNLTQSRPEIIGRYDSACFTLHWLHDNGSNIITYLAGNAQLLFNGLGITKGHMEHIVM